MEKTEDSMYDQSRIAAHGGNLWGHLAERESAAREDFIGGVVPLMSLPPDASSPAEARQEGRDRLKALKDKSVDIKDLEDVVADLPPDVSAEVTKREADLYPKAMTPN